MEEHILIDTPPQYQHFVIIHYGFAGTYLMETDSKGLNHWKRKIPNGEYEILGFSPEKKLKLKKTATR